MLRRAKSRLVTAGCVWCFSSVILCPNLFSQSRNIQELTQPCVGKTEVVICLEQLVLVNPENTELRRFLAYFHAKGGDERRALTEIEEALSIDPSDIENHVFRAQLLKKLGELDAARVEGERIRELKQAQRQKLLTEPVENVDELRLQAHLAEVAGEFEAASRLYRRYFELKENPHPSNLSNYAEVLARLGRFDSALEVMERAFAEIGEENSKARASLLKKRAWIREISGDEAGAEDDRREYESLIGVLSSSKTSSGRSGGVNPQ